MTTRIDMDAVWASPHGQRRGLGARRRLPERAGVDPGVVHKIGHLLGLGHSSVKDLGDPFVGFGSLYKRHSTWKADPKLFTTNRSIVPPCHFSHFTWMNNQD
nr:hypothetical protein Itr_chr07CG08150 [Ipomoea trifida]